MSWQAVDKRSLKCLKRKLGPPDYYPQRPDQKEVQNRLINDGMGNPVP